MFSWNCKLEDRDSFLFLVHYHYVWFQVRDNDTRGQCTPSSCLFSINVNVNLTMKFLLINTQVDVMRETVMPKCVSSIIQAPVQNVVKCLPFPTKTLLIGQLAPLFKVNFCMKGVNA